MKKVILGIALVAVALSVNFCGVRKYAEKTEAAQEELKEVDEAYPAEKAYADEPVETNACLGVALF